MKIKTIIITGVVIITIFIIYLTTIDKRIYYLDLNVNNYHYSEETKKYILSKNKLEKFVTGYTKVDDRTTDLINNIKQNKKIKIKNKFQSIKNALIKADLVTITTGKSDLLYKMLNSDDKVYEYADEIISDIENLMKLLREYCKEDIILIGLINEYGNQYQELFQYINQKLGEICYENKIFFINPMSVKNTSKTDEQLEKQIKQIIQTKILD